MIYSRLATSQNEKAYHCFCSPTELAEIRKTQLKKKATVSYDGRCRHLTEEEVVRRKKAGETSVVRFKVSISMSVVSVRLKEKKGVVGPRDTAQYTSRPNLRRVQYPLIQLLGLLLNEFCKWNK